MTALNIECVLARDVEKFARQEAETARPDSIVPISVSRARAWRFNPHAEPDDVVLLVARIEGNCVGYLGLLPGLVHVHDRVERMSWFSTFYVLPELRSRAVGGLLLMRALALGRSLAVVGVSQEAERVYRAAHFVEPQAPTYFALDFARKWNWPGLPLRVLRRTVMRANPWLDVAIASCASVTARVVLPTLLALATRRLGRWSTRPLEQLPGTARSSRSGVHFVRDAALLDWMLKYAWVSADRAEAVVDSYFDDFREEYSHRLFEVREPSGDTPCGWMILWFHARDGYRRLHVLDHELPDAVAADALLVSTLREATRCRANCIVVPQVCQSAFLRLGLPGRLFCQQQRRAFCRPHSGSALQQATAELELDYVDGDTGFA